MSWGQQTGQPLGLGAELPAPLQRGASAPGLWGSPLSPVSSHPCQSRPTARVKVGSSCGLCSWAQEDSTRERACSCPSGPPSSASSRLLSRVSDPSKQPESRGMSPLSSEGEG